MKFSRTLSEDPNPPVITIAETPKTIFNLGGFSKNCLDFGENTQENRDKMLGVDDVYYKRYLLQDCQGNYSNEAIFLEHSETERLQYYIFHDLFKPFSAGLSGNKYKLKYVITDLDDYKVPKNLWEDTYINDTGIVIDSQTYEPTKRDGNDNDVCTGGTNTNNNKKDKKDEINLPLIIGVSVGGFVLLAIILYYFMRKGKGKKSSGKSNNSSNKKGGSRKAVRGRSK